MTSDTTTNNFPNDYDSDKIDSRVALRSKSVRSKVYGKDVREALAQGIEISSTVSEEAKAISNVAKTQSQNIDDRFNDQIAGSTNDNETIDFRHSDMLEKSYQTTKLRGDFWDNEFQNRGVNVDWYGAVGDGITDDTAAIQKAIEAADIIILSKNKTYAVTSLKIEKSDFVLLGNNSKIISIGTSELLKVGVSEAPSYSKNVVINDVTLDCNLTASKGFYAMNTVCTLNNVIILNNKQYAFYATTDTENVSSYSSITNVRLNNCSINMDSAKWNWSNGENLDNTGLYLNASDCYINNLDMVHQTFAVINKGANFFTELHPWIINDYQMSKGVFMDTTAGSVLTDCYSDTYPTDFKITGTVNMYLSNFKTYYNGSYYSLAKYLNHIIPTPIKFDLSASNADTKIHAINSRFVGSEYAGGVLANVQEYFEYFEFENCDFSFLENRMLSTSQKNKFKNNFESNNVSAKTASTSIPAKDSYSSVTLKPFTIVSENIGGSFNSDEGLWYKKSDSSAATLSIASNTLIVSSGSPFRFGCAYTNIDYPTYLFLRLTIKTSLDLKLDIVDRNSGIPIGKNNSFSIYHKDDYQTVYFWIDLSNLSSKVDVEFVFRASSGTTINIKEVTLYDIIKRNIGYQFEVIEDLCSRLDAIGFVDGAKTLPLPTNQDFIIKSVPFAYSNRMFVTAQDATDERTAFRRLEGIDVSGNNGGNNPYKALSYSILIPEDGKLKGKLYLHKKITLVKFDSTINYISDNTFSCDTNLDGVFKNNSRFYSNEPTPILISRNTNIFKLKLLLSSGTVTGGNRCFISDFLLTPVSGAKIFKTPTMQSGSGYQKLPIFENGQVLLMSGGGGFADVEILS